MRNKYIALYDPVSNEGKGSIAGFYNSKGEFEVIRPPVPTNQFDDKVDELINIINNIDNE